MEQKLNWKKVEAFALDKSFSEYGFVTRLAFENRWTINFTKKAIVEYKKFMFLAATSTEMVSPSEIVDIVWHQHLIFTQSYDEFCTILGKKIEHIPSTHDINEKVKFIKAKENTVKLYEQNFGKQPDEFWKFVTMLDSLNLQKSKNSYNNYLSLGIASIVIFIFPFYLFLKPIYSQINSSIFLISYFLIGLLVWFFLNEYNQRELEKIKNLIPKSAPIFDLTPAELIVYKTDKIQNVIHGFVNQAYTNKIINIGQKGLMKINNKIEVKSDFDKVILDELNNFHSAYYLSIIRSIISKPIFVQLANSKNEFILAFNNSKQFLRLFFINLCIIVPFLLFGYSRILTGLYRGKSIAFIIILMIIFTILSMVFIEDLRNKFVYLIIPKTYIDKFKVQQNVNSMDWQWQYFFLGSAFLSNGFEPLTAQVNSRMNSNNSSGSACGSGCGSSCGSSCGGGCGGCGGD